MAEGVQLQGTLGFEEWIDYVFDHDDPGWHWEDDGLLWNEEPNPAITLNHLGRLFADPKMLLGRFTPDEVGAGINYLINPSCSNHIFVLLKPDLPLESRLACIRSIARLYSDLFPVICLPPSEIMNEPMRTEADSICSMFWDVFPLHPRTKNPHSCSTSEVKDHWEMHLQIEAACMEAMEASLKVDHPSCQEAALSGLGLWFRAYPGQVQSVIDSYLARADILPGLRDYAEQARVGMV